MKFVCTACITQSADQWTDCSLSRYNISRKI